MQKIAEHRLNLKGYVEIPSVNYGMNRDPEY